MKKVSVILPNYNHDYFLEKRIDSILTQSYQNFELIILDDASKDDSLTILNKYKNHPKVSHFEVNANNSGSPFLQWYKGIKLAKNELIWIAESDDWCEPSFLEHLVSKFEEEPNLTLAFTNSKLVNEKKNQNLILDQKAHTGFKNALQEDFFHNWFFKNAGFRIINASACIFNKEKITTALLEELRTFKYAGDKFFWLNLLFNGPQFYYEQRTLNIQFAHDRTTRTLKDVKGEYTRIKEIIEIYKFYIGNTSSSINDEIKRELGFRSFELFVYGILSHQNPFTPFSKYLISSIFKEKHRTIKLVKNLSIQFK